MRINPILRRHLCELNLSVELLQLFNGPSSLAQEPLHTLSNVPNTRNQCPASAVHHLFIPPLDDVSGLVEMLDKCPSLITLTLISQQLADIFTYTLPLPLCGENGLEVNIVGAINHTSWPTLEAKPATNVTHLHFIEAVDTTEIMWPCFPCLSHVALPIPRYSSQLKILLAMPELTHLVLLTPGKIGNICPTKIFT
jgi:hypothetical protein